MTQAANRLPFTQRLLALVWGLAEAVVFFVVPDVLISYIALQGSRRALAIVPWALAGALIGGAWVYWMGQSHEPQFLALYERLPAVSDGLIERVDQSLRTEGWVGLLIGGLSGAPYKLFAAQAADAGQGFWFFMGASVIARCARFVLVAFLAGWLVQLARRRYSQSQIRKTWWLLWLLFYAAYWGLMPG